MRRRSALRSNLSLFGTMAIVMFLAVVIAMLLADAIEEATKPVPGWPTPSATTTRK